MLKEFVDRIVGLAAPVTTTIAGQVYAKRDHSIVPVQGPTPEPLVVGTLAAVVTYLQFSSSDSLLANASTILHIDDPATVSVRSWLTETAQRHRYLIAKASTPVQGELQKMTQDHFILLLQRNYVDTQERKDLIALCGNVTAERVNTSSDDGVTQTVGKRVGATLKATERVKNPWSLKPYRTFREIDQPNAQFVLRVHYENDEAKFSLTETSDDSWKLTAVNSLHIWFLNALGDTPGVTILG